MGSGIMLVASVDCVALKRVGDRSRLQQLTQPSPTRGTARRHRRLIDRRKLCKAATERWPPDSDQRQVAPRFRASRLCPLGGFSGTGHLLQARPQEAKPAGSENRGRSDVPSARAMSTENRQRIKPKRSLVLLLAVAAAAAPLLYLLSAGPVVLGTKRLSIKYTDALEAFYSPAEKLYTRSQLYRKYMDWWLKSR